jgi:hypothetical protein
MKSKVFIGSAVEALDVAYATQDNLAHTAETTVWDQDIFKLSTTSLESLLKILKRVDFAIFIFSPNDVASIRDTTSTIVRDNVLYELGLFTGHLGIERCFIIKPMNSVNFHIATDLMGLTLAEYDSKREDQNLRAALGPACNKIRQAIKAKGRFSFEEEWLINEPVLRAFPPCTNNQNLAGLWLSRFTYSVIRNRQPVKGVQYDIEFLVSGSQPSLIGRNLLCSSYSGKLYLHELRVQILGNYLLGSWFNTNTQNIGAFQLHIHTHNCVMFGKHIGNANDNSIPHGEWTWIKIESDSINIEEQAVKIMAGRLKPIDELDKNFTQWTEAAAPLKIEWLVEF